MKKIIIICLSSLFISCSQDAMDEVNKDKNNAFSMESKNMIPDLLLKTGYETTATDMAWYSSVYVEHNAGTWDAFYSADRRVGQENASLLNNSWNALYDVMNIAYTIIKKTDPNNGDEPDNFYTRGIAQVMMAYNLGIATDGWGEIPYKEAFRGSNNLNPMYEKQSDIYKTIFNLIDEGIANLSKATNVYNDKDYFYGKLEGQKNIDAWIKAAYAIKARHLLRLSKVDTSVLPKVIDAVNKSFTSNDDNLKLGEFVVDVPGGNPWGELWYVRQSLASSSTINSLLVDRKDIRRDYYFSKLKVNNAEDFVIAPIGESNQVQGGYSESKFTSGWNAFKEDILLFSYHELKFIEAEALFKTGGNYKSALNEAIKASFDLVGAPNSDTYISSEVEPRLTGTNNILDEILTQKYIAFYDREALQAYFNYKRTGIPKMHNPNNKTVGFVQRFPYALSETSSNKINVPKKTIFDKVWWAGGSE